ncbi:MAG: copper resistance protein CopC [Caldilineaceae bacterium]
MLIAMCVVLSAPHIAAAHALLLRSLPAANAELTSAPAQVELWFSEPLEASISRAWVVDAAGAELSDGSATVDADDATHMTLQMPALEPGIYTVVYRTLSQADGHEWLGSFPLILRNADGTRPVGAGSGPAAVGASTSGALPTPLEAFSRWLSLMGALLAVGAISFRWIVAAAPGRAQSSTFTQAAGRLPPWGLLVGCCALIIGGWLQLSARRLALGGEAWSALLLGTRSGNLLLVRTGGAAALLLLAWFALYAPALSRPNSTSWHLGVSVAPFMQLALGLAILSAFSAGSHASAVAGRNWAILGDLIHFVAAAVWMGGLLLLAILLWQMRHSAARDDAVALRQTVQRFSTTAVVAVFVLICSGIFSSVVQLPTLDLLWRSAYGWLLLGKVALVLTALGAAFLNHRLVRGPHAEQWLDKSYAKFLRQVWSESAVGLGVMMVAAVLVQTPVPQPAANIASYFTTILAADDLSMHFQITPNQVGDNEYIVHLYHDDNSAIGEVQMVRLSFTHQSAELGQASLELAEQGGGLYMATGAYQNRAGPWDIAVYVRRRGMDDVLTTTTVDVPPPSGAAVADPWQNPIRAVAPGLLPTVVIVAVLLLQLLWFGGKR